MSSDGEASNKSSLCRLSHQHQHLSVTPLLSSSAASSSSSSSLPAPPPVSSRTRSRSKRSRSSSSSSSSEAPLPSGHPAPSDAHEGKEKRTEMPPKRQKTLPKPKRRAASSPDAVINLAAAEEEEGEVRKADDEAAEEEERKECGICYEEIGERGHIDCCDHLFCVACIKTWTQRCSSCPCCKRDIKTIVHFCAKTRRILSIDQVPGRALRDTIVQEEVSSSSSSNANMLHHLYRSQRQQQRLHQQQQRYSRQHQMQLQHTLDRVRSVVEQSPQMDLARRARIHQHVLEQQSQSQQLGGWDRLLRDLQFYQGELLMMQQDQMRAAGIPISSSSSSAFDSTMVNMNMSGGFISATTTTTAAATSGGHLLPPPLQQQQQQQVGFQSRPVATVNVTLNGVPVASQVNSFGSFMSDFAFTTNAFLAQLNSVLPVTQEMMNPGSRSRMTSMQGMRQQQQQQQQPQMSRYYPGQSGASHYLNGFQR